VVTLYQRILYERQPSTTGATARNAGENGTKESTQATSNAMNELKEISSFYHALIQWQLEWYGKDHGNTSLVYYSLFQFYAYLISLLPPSTLSSRIYTRKEEETITKKEGKAGDGAASVEEEKLSSKALEAMINETYQLTNAVYRNTYDGPIIELQLLLLKLYSSQMNYWKEKQKLDFILSSLLQL
jgi:hypothetical protein